MFAIRRPRPILLLLLALLAAPSQTPRAQDIGPARAALDEWVMQVNETPADQIVFTANARCDQENLIGQLGVSFSKLRMDEGVARAE